MTDRLQPPNAGQPVLPKPSLATLEKAAAVKVFFETKYHAILRQPRFRERTRDILERELSRLDLPDSGKHQIRVAWLKSQTQYLRELREKVGVNSFIRLKTIGHGAFGVVYLVREIATGKCVHCFVPTFS